MEIDLDLGIGVMLLSRDGFSSRLKGQQQLSCGIETSKCTHFMKVRPRIPFPDTGVRSFAVSRCIIPYSPSKE